MTKLYGIKNCDTVRKARKWLEQEGAPYEFCDFRESPPEPATLQHWLDSAGEALLNKRSTTWKQLSEAERQADVIALLANHPTLIKRPVLEYNGKVAIGFSSDQYHGIMNSK